MPTEDRRVGKLLPNPVTPATTVCFMIEIPNAVAYRAAFLGQINVLGQALTWDHPTDGTDCLDCEQAAQLWRNAIFEATWSDECGSVPMSCEGVADCFENDPAFREAAMDALLSDPETKSALINSLINDPTFTSELNGALGGGGLPAPAGDMAGDTNPSCNHDILWAQCLAVVQNTNAAIIDVLEKIEVTTNSIELIDAASEIPFVGWAKEVIGGQAALDLIQYYQEALTEQYSAQYTTTVGGVEDQIACALFCEAKLDCELTVERIWSVFKGRLEAYITVPQLNSLGDLIDFAAGMSQDNTMVVDAAFFVAWAGVALGSYLFGEVFDVSMEMIIKLAVNDASNDWETLCEDCPPEDDCIDFRESNQGWAQIVANYAIYHNTEGWGPNAARNRIGIQKIDTGSIIGIDVKLNGTVPRIDIHNHYSKGWAILATKTGAQYTIDGEGFYVYSFTFSASIAGIGIECIDFASSIPTGRRIVETCIHYA